uniref:Uncharacterized protein n=1 Tax=Rhizophora mucronata TaxID=61149 RepID=A0A2P2JIV7_RHIMU
MADVKAISSYIIEMLICVCELNYVTYRGLGLRFGVMFFISCKWVMHKEFRI